MNIKKLNEEMTNILESEVVSYEFMLTGLEYVIDFNSGRSYRKNIDRVDSLGYKLYDLGPATITDIVLKNMEDSGLELHTNDSSQIEYDAQTGIIKNSHPILFFDDDDKEIAKLSFKVTLWGHPEKFDRLF